MTTHSLFRSTYVSWRNCCLHLLLLSVLGIAWQSASASAAKPIKALMISGGCCHDYPNQNLILSEGISMRAHVEWTLVNQGGTARDVRIPIYDDESGQKHHR